MRLPPAHGKPCWPRPGRTLAPALPSPEGCGSFSPTHLAGCLCPALVSRRALGIGQDLRGAHVGGSRRQARGCPRGYSARMCPEK